MKWDLLVLSSLNTEISEREEQRKQGVGGTEERKKKKKNKRYQHRSENVLSF